MVAGKIDVADPSSQRSVLLKKVVICQNASNAGKLWDSVPFCTMKP